MDIIEKQSECMNNLCTNQSLKVCTLCRFILYCSKECQVQNWKRHKKFCKMISSSPEMRLRYEKAVEDYKIAMNKAQRGKFDKALLSLQESLEVFQEYQYDSGISNCYYSIGNVLRMKGQQEEALVNFRKALEIYKEIHGENHASTCDCYECIGSVLSEQGRHDDALIGFGKALAIRMKFFGENHIDTARSYYHIGLNQLQKCDCDGALISFQKAKKIYTHKLGAEHPKTVKVNTYIDFCQQRIDLRNKVVQTAVHAD